MLYQDRNRARWEYVCHVPDAGSATGQVVLRGSDGKTVVVPAGDVGDDSKTYALVAGKPVDGAADALKELLAYCRHVSTLRFVALPVFLTGMAALAKESLMLPAPAPAYADLLAKAGLGLSLVLLVFETVLSFNLISWWAAFGLRAEGTPWKALIAHRQLALLWLARIALFAPYPVAAAFWSQKLTGLFEVGFIGSALIYAVPTLALWVWAAHVRKPG